MMKYERMNVVQSKEQAESIVHNLRGNGKKAYYRFGYEILVEVENE